MLSAARLPQVRAEVCISLQASPNHIRRTKSSIKKRIIVRRSVRSMFGEQTFAQLRTGFKKACCASHICLNHIVPPRTKRTNQSRSSAEGRDWTRMFRELTSVNVRRGGEKKATEMRSDSFTYYWFFLQQISGGALDCDTYAFVIDCIFRHSPYSVPASLWPTTNTTFSQSRSQSPVVSAALRTCWVHHPYWLLNVLKVKGIGLNWITQFVWISCELSVCLHFPF